MKVKEGKEEVGSMRGEEESNERAGRRKGRGARREGDGSGEEVRNLNRREKDSENAYLREVEC